MFFLSLLFESLQVLLWPEILLKGKQLSPRFFVFLGFFVWGVFVVVLFCLGFFGGSGGVFAGFLFYSFFLGGLFICLGFFAVND